MTSGLVCMTPSIDTSKYVDAVPDMRTPIELPVKRARIVLPDQAKRGLAPVVSTLATKRTAGGPASYGPAPASTEASAGAPVEASAPGDASGGALEPPSPDPVPVKDASGVPLGPVGPVEPPEEDPPFCGGGLLPPLPPLDPEPEASAVGTGGVAPGLEPEGELLPQLA